MKQLLLYGLLALPAVSLAQKAAPPSVIIGQPRRDAVQDSLLTTQSASIAANGQKNFLLYGGVRGGATGNSAALSTLANTGNVTIYLPEGVYKLDSTITLRKSNIKLIGDGIGKTIITGNLTRLINITSANNIQIEGISFQSTFVSDYTQTTEDEAAANGFLVGVTINLAIADSATNIKLLNCGFASPFGSVNGVKIISHRSGTGGYVKGVTIDNSDFSNIGRAAIEILGEGTAQYYQNIRITNSRFKNLGVWSQYGFGVSLSGWGNTIVDNCVIDGAKNIGLENASNQYTTFSNIVMRNLKPGCIPYTVNGSDGTGTYKLGNVVENIRVEGYAPAGPQLSFQKGLVSRGNSVSMNAGYVIVNNVHSSIFDGDSYNSTSNLTINLKGGSSKNTFTSSIISSLGASAYGYAVTVFDSASNNSFDKITYFKGNAGGEFINETTNNNAVTSLYNNTGTRSVFGKDFSKPSQLLSLGGNILWFDTGNNLRYKTSSPTSTTDGSNLLDATSGVTTNTTQTITGTKTFTSFVTAAFGRGLWLNPTLNSVQDYGTSIGLDIQPTFSVGSFVGTDKVGLRLTAGKLRVTSDVIQAQAGLEVTSGIKLLTTPTTSATITGKQLLTYNPATGTIEKIDSIPNLVTTNTTQTITGAKTFAPFATGSFARGIWLNPSLAATQSFGTLIGVDISPSFSQSGFSGNDFVSLRVASGIARFGGTVQAQAGLVVTGTTSTGKIVGTEALTSITAGVGAGTSPTVSVAGTSMGGIITITTGTSPSAGALATLTFATAYATNAPVVVVSGAQGTSLSVNSQGESTLGFSIATKDTPAASTTYRFAYVVIGR